MSRPMTTFSAAAFLLASIACGGSSADLSAIRTDAVDLSAAANALVRQDFKKIPIQPFSAAFAAGELCDFRYQVASLGGTVIRVRFYDADGTKIRAILIGDETIQHTNLETGFSIVEELHGMTDRDFVTGEETTTGLFWHGQTEDGRLVIGGAGRAVYDLWTGELLDSTPNVHPDPGLCSVLGGAPGAP